MPSRRVPVDLNAGTYFLTLTVQRWYYLFDRHNRWPILADSIRYCREHKGLELNGYVFMLNHIHLIVTSPDLTGFLRDFKRFTSKQLKENIAATEPGVLKLFVDDAGTYRLWMDTNAPKKIENPDFYVQKLNYVHENPVRKGYVARAEHWVWSSANPDSPLEVGILS
ncbi:transposase [uncultured Thiodictyon sp.]|jgi:REP element-mobilizing transposase RayT|uniref:REP-associated tyrosine transposase n=1 Tax=uncultured Thiodictyon sp. TaxID=1846217 RepID=UPI0025DBC0A3|nr:transposase [uncultured Thiodictyon sp.]